MDTKTLKTTSIVISTSEIIQPRFFVIDVAAIPEGLHSAQCSGHTTCLADGAAPCIIHIVYHSRASAVKNGHNIALQILDIAVRYVVVHNYSRLVLRIIEEVQIIAALGHVHHILAMQRVFRYHPIYSFLHSQAIFIINESGCGVNRLHLLELPTIFPSAFLDRAGMIVLFSLEAHDCPAIYCTVPRIVPPAVAKRIHRCFSLCRTGN